MTEPTSPKLPSAEDSTATRFDVFLSHNSKDKKDVERIAEKLKRVGLEPWLDKWCLTPGGDSPEELAEGLRVSAACAVFIGRHDIGNWQDLEYKSLLSRMVKDRAFRLFPVLLPGLPEPFNSDVLPPFLSVRTWVDLRKGIEDTRAFQSLINAIKGVPLGPEHSIEPRNDTCPYRGLQTFDEAHAEFFFGRDGDIQRLVEKLKGTRFLAVLGPSGSGKSSLVRAGLIPALRKGQLPGSDTWPIQIFTPTAHPLTQLAANLLRLYPQGAMSQTLDQMLSDERTLHLAVAQAMADASANERTVLVVDQFEEVFTLCRDDHERAQFLANLLYAAFVPGGRCVVLLTMRADFYSKCAAYPDLSARLAEQQFLVSPMSSDGLRQAIEEPAWRVGLEFESGLAATILDDVNERPGALPLLEHALLELWERRRGGMLTLEAYRESGAVEGAIAKRADSIYDLLTREQQAIVRRVMIRLTQFGEGTEDTRRRATMSELITRPDESEAVESVVKEMADARLLTTSKDEQTDERWVDVSHEALIQGWPTLRDWIEADRTGWQLHRRLTEAAQEWQHAGRDQDLLYRGTRLAQTMDWYARDENEAELNELERDFVNASVALQDKEQRALQKRRKSIITFLTVALTLTGVALAIAVWQRRSAISREKAATAINILADNPELGLFLANEAFLLQDNQETQNALRLCLLKSRLHTIVSPEEHGARFASEPNAGKFSPDGHYLHTIDSHDLLQLWDTNSGRHIAEWRNVASAAFSQDSQWIAIATSQDGIEVWDIASKKIVQRISEWADLLAFSPDGKLLTDGYRIWEINSGKLLIENDLSLSRRARHIDKTAWFTPNGKGVVVMGEYSYITDVSTGEITSLGEKVAAVTLDATLFLSNERPLRLINIKTQKIIATLPGYYVRGSFSPDGKYLVAAGTDETARADETARVYETGSGREIANPLSHPSTVSRCAFSSDGSLVLTFCYDMKVRIWETQGWQILFVFDGGNASFSPNGKLLSIPRNDGKIFVWDILTRGNVRFRDSSSPIVDMSFSPNSNLLAAVDDNNRILVWDPTTEKIKIELTRTIGEKKVEVIRQLTDELDKEFYDFQKRRKLLIKQTKRMDKNSRGFLLLSGILSHDYGKEKEELKSKIDREMKIRSIKFSADGRYLIATSDKYNFGWEVNTWEPVPFVPQTIIFDPNQQKSSFALPDTTTLSPDGKLAVALVKEGQQRIARVNELSSQRVIDLPVDKPSNVGTLSSGAARVSQPIIRFSPNGKFLVITDNEGQIHIYPWELFAPFEDVVSSVHRRIDEVKIYLKK